MDMADSPAAALAAFEARCDPSDPQQAALLEQMRQHTRELQRANWATQPNQRRSWNAPPPADRAKPPSANESLRAYKEHLAAEKQRGKLPLSVTAAAAEQRQGGPAAAGEQGRASE